MLLSAAVLFAGTAVAYYNTSSLGYGEAVVFSYGDGVLNVMDNEIDIRKVKQYIDNVLNNIIEEPITI